VIAEIVERAMATLRLLAASSETRMRTRMYSCMIIDIIRVMEMTDVAPSSWVRVREKASGPA
jgi:hypothetical protein